MMKTIQIAVTVYVLLLYVLLGEQVLGAGEAWAMICAGIIGATHVSMKYFALAMEE